MTTAVKWLFVGLNLPLDWVWEPLMAMDGWVGRWLDMGGGSTVNDYNCKPTGSLPVGFYHQGGKLTPATRQMLVQIYLVNKPLTLIKRRNKR